LLPHAAQVPGAPQDAAVPAQSQRPLEESHVSPGSGQPFCAQQGTGTQLELAALQIVQKLLPGLSSHWQELTGGHGGVVHVGEVTQYIFVGQPPPPGPVNAWQVVLAPVSHCPLPPVVTGAVQLPLEFTPQ